MITPTTDVDAYVDPQWLALDRCESKVDLSNGDLKKVLNFELKRI